MLWMAGVMAMMTAASQPAAAPAAGMDHAAVDCPAVPAALPPELAGWSQMVPVAAGASAERAATLTLGVGAKAALLPTPTLSYPLRPEKPGGPASSGGLFAFAAPAAGRYRVALGAGAWIDVVRDGAAVVSSTHGHGPDCSGVRKTVDFDLLPGRYLLQVSGNAASTLPLLVGRLQ